MPSPPPRRRCWPAAPAASSASSGWERRSPSPGGDPARVTVVRCAPVIGAGAPWVVLLRALGDRLPVIPCPAWMRRADRARRRGRRRARARLARGRRARPIPTATTWRASDRTTYRELLALVAAAHGRRPRLVDAGIAGDVVTRVALGVAARSEPEVAALAASLPAPEAVARGDSLLRLADLPDHAARLGHPRGRRGRPAPRHLTHDAAPPRRSVRGRRLSVAVDAGSAVMLPGNRDRRYDPWRRRPPRITSTAPRPAKPRRLPLNPGSAQAAMSRQKMLYGRDDRPRRA